ncbi:hypothetical protein D1872_271890 [compost metagenome]
MGIGPDRGAPQQGAGHALVRFSRSGSNVSRLAKTRPANDGAVSRELLYYRCASFIRLSVRGPRDLVLLFF